MNRTKILVLLALSALCALAFWLLRPLLSGEDAMKVEAARLLRETQPVRLSMLELYASNGAWPNADELTGIAGLPLELLPNGVLKARLELPRHRLASALYFRPERHGTGMRLACTVNDPALRPIAETFPDCTFDAAFEPQKFAFEEGPGPTPAVDSSGGDPCGPASAGPVVASGELEAGGVTITPLGGEATLLLGKLGAGGYPLPGVWNERTRRLHPMDPFWNATDHTATPIGERAALIAGGRRTNWSSGDETSDRVLLVAPCTRTVLGRGSLLTARRNHLAVALDEYRVLIAGGDTRTAPTAEAETFDTRSMKSTPAAPMHEARAGALAVLLADGRIMVLGGSGPRDPRSVELYDPASGEWSATGALGESRRDGMTATLLRDGRVLVAGGATPALGIPLALAEVWDPATGAWRRVTPMLTGRKAHAASVLPDGRVLVAGGAVAAYSEIYDPAQDRWTLGPPQPQRHKESANVFAPSAEARMIAAGITAWNERLHLDGPRKPGLRVWRTDNAPAALPDGRLLIAGGAQGGDLLRHAEIYDPATDRAVETGPLQARRQQHRTFVLPGGDVLVLGGKGAWTDKGELSEGPLPAERWNHATQQWTVQLELTLTPEQAASAALLDDGDIVFFDASAPVQGTGGDSDAVPATRVLRWQQATGEVAEQGRLERPRTGFRALSLPGGRVLVAGGFERTRHDFKPAASTELWDPARRVTIPMAQPDGPFAGADRNSAPAIMLRVADGRALVAGPGGSALYDPRLDRWEPGPPEVKANADRWLATPDGRVVRVHKAIGQWPQVTLIDPLSSETRSLPTPKGQCVSEGAVTATLELVLMTDFCAPGAHARIERWPLDPPRVAARRRWRGATGAPAP
jgi:hypothetical protein